MEDSSLYTIPSACPLNACAAGCENGVTIAGTEQECWCEAEHYYSAIGNRCIKWCNATVIQPGAVNVDCCGTEVTDASVRYMEPDNNCICGGAGLYVEEYGGCKL